MRLGSAPARPVLQIKTRRCIAATDVKSPVGGAQASRLVHVHFSPFPGPSRPEFCPSCRRPYLSNFTRPSASSLFLVFVPRLTAGASRGISVVGVFHPWSLGFCRSRASQPARGPRSVLTGLFSMPSLAASPVEWAFTRRGENRARGCPLVTPARPGRSSAYSGGIHASSARRRGGCDFQGVCEEGVRFSWAYCGCVVCFGSGH